MTFGGGGGGTLNHNTIARNGYGGVYISGPLVTLRDNVIALNTNLGVSVNPAGGRAVMDPNLVWGHALDDLTNVTAGSGYVNANPLFVSDTDFTLTANSPARRAASDVTDLGAFPFASDPTPQLEGTLFSNTTLSGSKILAGDLTVPTGVTLTIEKGTTLTAAASDDMRSGLDPSRVELIVNGTLIVQGTASYPVTFAGSGGAGSWYGIRVLSGTGTKIAGAVIGNAVRALDLSASVSVTGTRLSDSISTCVVVRSGTCTFSDSRLTGCVDGALLVVGGTANLDTSVVTGGVGSAFAVRFLGGGGTLSHDTIARNAGGGLFANGPAAVTVGDSIIAFNTGTGVSRAAASAGTFDYNANDVFGHATADLSNVTSGPNSLNVDPLFVSTSDLHLLEASPCRGKGTQASDLGALPYVPPVDKVVIAGPTTVDAGSLVTFSAKAFDAAGNEIPASIAWSAAAAAGTIDGGGILSAACAPRAVKGAVIAKTPNGKSASADLTIVEGAPAKLTVSASPITLDARAVQRVSASVQDGCGNAVTAAVTWKTAPGAGTIDAAGSFTAPCAPGDFPGAITATVGSLTASADVKVVKGPLASLSLSPGNPTVPIKGQAQLSAAAADTCGNSLPSNVAWSVAGGGTINASGLFVAGTVPGNFAVTAKQGAVSGSTTVAIVPGPVAAIALTPKTATVPAGATTSFSAQAFDAAQNQIPNAVISWTAAPAAGTIDQAGGFKASCTVLTAPGAVVATNAGVSGSADVTIVPAAPSEIQISPGKPKVAAKGAVAFTALVRDACKNPTGATVTWSTKAEAGTIDASGSYTAPCAPKLHTLAVLASAGAITASVDVEVQEGPLEKIAIDPADPTVSVEGTIPFKATGTDSCGNTVKGAFTWGAAPVAGTISPSGLFTARVFPGTYANSISASAGGVHAATGVTVTAGSADSLAISPSTAILSPGGKQKFALTGKDRFGNPVAVAGSWKLVSGGGTIDATTGELVADTKAGVYPGTVRAEAEGIFALAAVKIENGPVSQISLDPQAATVTAGDRQPFTARARDAFGNEVPGVAFTWSADLGAGTVTQEGMFTAGNVPGEYPSAVSAEAGGIAGSAAVSIVARSSCAAGDCAKGAPVPVVGCGVSGAPLCAPWGAVSAISLLLRRRRHSRFSARSPCRP